MTPISEQFLYFSCIVSILAGVVLGVIIDEYIHHRGI